MVFSLCSGSIVLLSLAFLMPAFYYIPKASLAAVIICAVAPMADYTVVKKMWKIYSRFLLTVHMGLTCCWFSVVKTIFIVNVFKFVLYQTYFYSFFSGGKNAQFSY